MTALVRYLSIKQWREGWLAALLVGPALAIMAPAIVFGIVQTARGRFSWPMTIPRNTEAGLDTIPLMLLIICALAACGAGFEAFAREATGHALGSIVLASSPQTVVLVSALFAATGAFVAFAVGHLAGVLVVASFTDAVRGPANPGFAMAAAQALVVCLCCASAGVAMVSISPVQTMMVPAGAIALTATIWASRNFGASRAAVVIVVTVLLLAVATWFTRRRCAA